MWMAENPFARWPTSHVFVLNFCGFLTEHDLAFIVTNLSQNISACDTLEDLEPRGTIAFPSA